MFVQDNTNNNVKSKLPVNYINAKGGSSINKSKSPNHYNLVNLHIKNILSVRIT